MLNNLKRIFHQRLIYNKVGIGDKKNLLHVSAPKERFISVITLQRHNEARLTNSSKQGLSKFDTCPHCLKLTVEAPLKTYRNLYCSS
jgi:hypothetical protein